MPHIGTTVEGAAAAGCKQRRAYARLPLAASWQQKPSFSWRAGVAGRKASYPHRGTRSMTFLPESCTVLQGPTGAEVPDGT